MPWRRELTTHSGFLAGEFLGQRLLAGYSLWGRKESDSTERLSHSLSGRGRCSCGLCPLTSSLGSLHRWDGKDHFHSWAIYCGKVSPGAYACFQSFSRVRLIATQWIAALPGFHVLHHLPELAQAHGPLVGGAIQPSHPLSSPPPAFNLSQHQGLFQ